MEPGAHARRRGGTRRPDRAFKWIAAVAGLVPGRLRGLRDRPRFPSRAPRVPPSPPSVPPPPVLKPGTVAPGFSLPSLAGTARSPSPLSGGRRSSSTSSPHGATTAGPSSAQWPRSPGQPQGRVVVVGVDSNDSSEAAATRLLAAAGATYPVAVDANATVASRVPRQRAPGQLFRQRGGAGGGAALGAQTGRHCSAGSHASTAADDGASRGGRGGIWPRRPSSRGSSRVLPHPAGGPGGGPRRGGARHPRQFVFWVLGMRSSPSLGGLLAEHVFSSAGLNPVPVDCPPAAATPTPATTPSAPTPAADRSLAAPLASFMGLSSPAPHRAPAFALTDQSGLLTSVPTQPARASS